jgi:hypothetical protein
MSQSSNPVPFSRFRFAQTKSLIQMKIQCLIQLNIMLQVTGLTSGRAAALVPAVLGLTGVIVGWVALSRSKSRNGNGRLGAMIAFGLCVVDLILSVIHLIRTSDSSIGTGSGKLGAIVAIGLGLLGLTLSGIAFLRSRASGTTNRE